MEDDDLISVGVRIIEGLSYEYGGNDKIFQGSCVVGLLKQAEIRITSPALEKVS